MRYLGLDLGTKTLGLSLSDDTGLIATPYQTIHFEDSNYDALLPQLKAIGEQFGIATMVLGFPKNMNNTVGERGLATIAFQEKLSAFLGIEVVLQDERLSTVEATHYMVKADISRKKRKKKIDSLAANIILQAYLDRKRGMN